MVFLPTAVDIYKQQEKKHERLLLNTNDKPKVVLSKEHRYRYQFSQV